jgi:hypothetical protein
MTSPRNEVSLFSQLSYAYNISKFIIFVEIFIERDCDPQLSLKCARYCFCTQNSQLLADLSYLFCALSIFPIRPKIFNSRRKTGQTSGSSQSVLLTFNFSLSLLTKQYLCIEKVIFHPTTCSPNNLEYGISNPACSVSKLFCLGKALLAF